jgi:hypothetical protein
MVKKNPHDYLDEAEHHVHDAAVKNRVPGPDSRATPLTQYLGGKCRLFFEHLHRGIQGYRSECANIAPPKREAGPSRV